MVLELSANDGAPTQHIVVAYNTRKKPIDVIVVHLTQLPGDLVPPGVLMTLSCERGRDGQLKCMDEKQFCLSLVQASLQWNMSILALGPVRDLRLFDALVAEPVGLVSLREQMQKEKEAKQALIAFQKLLQKPSKGKKNQGRGKGRSKGSGKGRKGKSKPNEFEIGEYAAGFVSDGGVFSV